MVSIKNITILLLMILAGLVIPAAAQNNPYKIDDSLYPLYRQAVKWRARPEGLLLADTLYNKAAQKKDKKAQCLALTIPMHYYSAANDFAGLERAAEELRIESRKNDYLQYYYFAYFNEINWLLNRGRTLLALQKAEEMKEHAFKDKHDYGIFSCIRTLGNIYRIRGNEDIAVKYYQSALEYMLEHLPEQDPAALYIDLIRYYRGRVNSDYSKALELAEEGLKTSKTSQSRIGVLLEKCQVLFWIYRTEFFQEGNMDLLKAHAEAFNACYDECTHLVKEYGGESKEVRQRLRVYKLIMDREYEKALEAVDLINNKMEVYRLRREIYLMSGNFKNAYLYASICHNYKDSLNRLVQSSDLAELTAQLDNERMKLRAKALEYENTKLSLSNTRLELEHTKSQAELEKMNAENSKLTLKNRNLELARLNVEAEKQKAILKEQQITSQHHIFTLNLVLSFLFLSICFLVFYLYRRRKSMALLREKNNELTIARDHAEQSDRMKMMFIQNMSHEIRTPLNAIVGFSQILSTPDMEISDEEKQDFSMLIQQNSELLTTLVNDVLDLSSLESGKYTMHLASHRCNDLCRNVLSSIKHRKPEEVKLRYTSDVADDFEFVTDEKRLQQVLVNFLTNAEKHTEQGEIRLHCSLAENPGKITFSVTDTGPGIPAEKADSIFERFNKLDEFKQGSGLGLNICRIISERLNGEVKLDKSYKGGARFLFVLPLN